LLHLFDSFSFFLSAISSFIGRLDFIVAIEYVFLRFKIFTVVKIQIVFFWVMLLPCFITHWIIMVLFPMA